LTKRETGREQQQQNSIHRTESLRSTSIESVRINMMRCARAWLVVMALAAASLPAQTPGTGKQVFDTRCAMCHGEDANGGEFAPGIVTRIATRTDGEIAAVIRNGLPNRGMPEIQLSEQALGDLIVHLRTLRPPRRGEIPATPVTIETTDSRKLSGIAVNQSFEDLQLRTADGRIHLLRREGLRFREVTSQVDWSTYDGQLTANRFATLKQIDKTNVAKLKPRWIFSMPDTPSSEMTPLVQQGIMYVTSGNECYALDAGTGRQIWRYQRLRPKGQAVRVNRGAAIAGDRVFMTTEDARVIALNRFTGELLWDTVMADPRQNYFATSAPLIAGDLVIPGVGGGDSGVRGFLAAFDQKTGKEVWRFWTIPAPGEAGSETWSGNSMAHPGGATWFTGSFDPELNLLYWQVGNPGPDHNGDQREGDNLYSDSVVALDVRTGKLKWHYQFTPHDVWDWDAQEPLVLADTCVAGSASQTAAAGESQWVLLRSRPSQRKTAPRQAVRGQADVGEGDRTGRASCQESGSGADPKRGPGSVPRFSAQRIGGRQPSTLRRTFTTSRQSRAAGSF
jgi:alcohol dehydrogenase (cytochrome c)